MKIRNGFVSNSSSSSFMIKVCDEIPTVQDLAKRFLQLKIKDASGRKAQVGKYIQKQKNLIKCLKNMPDKNTSIIIPTCNYDTYIVCEDDYFVINTCHNENSNWEDLQEFRCYPEGKRQNEWREWEEYRFGHLNFFHLESGRIVEELDDYESCEKCYNKLFLIDGELQCIEHGKDFGNEN